MLSFQVTILLALVFTQYVSAFSIHPFYDTLVRGYESKKVSKTTAYISEDDSQEPDIENETAEERAARMDLVRQLQKSFYQDEAVIEKPKSGSTIIRDLPLWRVQWTELPGFQNVLNVHVPHYTNMFQKIIYSDSNPKYFGHIYLPGGSDNLDNPEYRMETGSKSTMIGTLMQISDYHQMDDGRFVMIVQGLERFRIVDVERHHSPYAIATVEIIPDDELIDAFLDVDGSEEEALVKAVKEAFDSHEYEISPITMDKNLNSNDPSQSILVSPLSNYRSNFKNSALVAKDFDNDDPIFEAEQAVWLKVNKMITLLQQLVKETSIPILSQILGLLPLNPPTPWPSDFLLEEYATKLEIEKVLVGTHSKTPFVRVDNSEEYSPIRRAQRFSFVVWMLTDTVIALANDEELTRQHVLEMESTIERLEAAESKLDVICAVISQILDSKDG